MPIYDEKKFLVFIDPEHIRIQIVAFFEATGTRGSLIEPEMHTKALTDIAAWARQEGGEVHYTKKPGRRSPRCAYSLKYTDGDQSQLLGQLNKQIKHAIAATYAALPDEKKGF